MLGSRLCPVYSHVQTVAAVAESHGHAALNGADAAEAPTIQQHGLPMLAEFHRRRPQPTGHKGVATIKVGAPTNAPQVERIGDASAGLADERAHVYGFGQGVGPCHRHAPAHAFGHLRLKTVVPAAEIVAQRPRVGRQDTRLEEDAVIDVVGCRKRVLETCCWIINRPRNKARGVKVADVV